MIAVEVDVALPRPPGVHETRKVVVPAEGEDLGGPSRALCRSPPYGP